MQPRLHIFSHFFALRPPRRQKRLLVEHLCAVRRALREGVGRQARLQFRRVGHLLHSRGLEQRCPMRPARRRPGRSCAAIPLPVTVADAAAQPLRSALMSLPSQQGSRRSSALLILALAVVAIAGCGPPPSGGTEAAPAGAVPASTPLYAGATVRPGEPLKAAARTAGQRLSHQADVYLRLLSALQTPGSTALTFNHDVAPWLGARAAIFLGSSASTSEASVS